MTAARWQRGHRWVRLDRDRRRCGDCGLWRIEIFVGEPGTGRYLREYANQPDGPRWRSKRVPPCDVTKEPLSPDERRESRLRYQRLRRVADPWLNQRRVERSEEQQERLAAMTLDERARYLAGLARRRLERALFEAWLASDLPWPRRKA